MENITKCPICRSGNHVQITNGSLFFPIKSIRPEFHKYNNYLCNGCGVVYMHPTPNEDCLREHYNSEYRNSNFSITVGEHTIDLPIQFPRSVISFQRFKTFYDTIKIVEVSYPNAIPSSDDLIIDYGGYQGMFLYASHLVFGSKGIVYDYNVRGVQFAKEALGLTGSRTAQDIYSDTFSLKSRFVTMIQTFEHIKDPCRLLMHIKNNILCSDGYFFLEVPNLYGYPLHEPTHFFTYTQESLMAVLHRNSFEVVSLYENGFPSTGSLIDNSRRKIVCMARPVMKRIMVQPLVGKRTTLSRLHREHRRLSWRALYNQLTRFTYEGLRLVYFGIFVIILEPLFKRRIDKIDGMLRRHIFNGRNLFD